jgi:hypothetical protein
MRSETFVLASEQCWRKDVARSCKRELLDRVYDGRFDWDFDRNVNGCKQQAHAEHEEQNARICVCPSYAP